MRVSFDRIEVGSKFMVLLLSPDAQQVSNITDSGYLGPKHTLTTLGPLLKPKFQNPRATLLALFLNAVHEIEPYNSSMMAVKRSDKHRMFKYITLTPKAFARGGTSNAYLIRFMGASVMFRDFDEPFRRFMGWFWKSPPHVSTRVSCLHKQTPLSFGLRYP